MVATRRNTTLLRQMTEIMIKYLTIKNHIRFCKHMHGMQMCVNSRPNETNAEESQIKLKSKKMHPNYSLDPLTKKRKDKKSFPRGYFL